jgi:uncharacterized protein (DUF1501 family)
MKKTHNGLMMNRRSLLRGLALTGGVSVFGGLDMMANLVDAYAKPTEPGQIPDRYYVFCYFSGGWDILLGLDPRDPSLFHNGNMATTKIQPGYELLTLPGSPLIGPRQDFRLGPFVGELMDPAVAEHLVVVRGMSMDTLTHEVGRRRFLTGKQPSGLLARGSSTDVWMASRLTRGEPLPNLSIRVESYNRDLPNSASAMRTNSVEDLLRVLSPGDVQLDDLQERQLDALLHDHSLCVQSQLSDVLQDAESARKTVRAMLDGRIDKNFDFFANTPEMSAIRDHFGLNVRDGGASPEIQAAIAATAITQRISRCVSIQVTSGLDTHFNNWITDQGVRQQRGFNAVARLAKYLKSRPYMNDPNNSDSWLDHTTIVGFSEFSRTPLLNAQEGRDHWLNNACFLIGGGVKGNRVIGKSSDAGMYPEKVNLLTGALDPDGEIIRPEHILQALYEEVGITHEPDLRVKALRGLMK